eukprot:5165073-Pyramimonas_sp.AAC.1
MVPGPLLGGGVVRLQEGDLHRGDPVRVGCVDLLAAFGAHAWKMRPPARIGAHEVALELGAGVDNADGLVPI